MSEFNPLVQRVDALLKRHQQQGPDVTLPMSAVERAATHAPAEVVAAPVEVESAATDDDIPVLTEVVEPQGAGEPPAVLAGQIEQAVMEKVIAELDRALEQRLGRAISDVLEQAVDGLRVDLAASVRETVRDAVATALRNGDQDRTPAG